MGGNELRSLNESFADIFSYCAEAYILPIHDPLRLPNFTFAEDVATGPIRSMSEPWNFGCPRAYNVADWQIGNTSESHRFSAIQTYWFYLLAYGSAGKPTEGNATVCGIGLDNATRVAYHSLIDYMQVGVTHQDAMFAAERAARDEFGLNSFEIQQSNDAWAAVGVGTSANSCNPVGAEGVLVEPILTLSTFPNPASTVLTVSFVSPKKETNCTLELWNSLGTKVALLDIPGTVPPGDYDTRLKCSGLAAGTYHLIFSSDRTHLSKNILIID